MKTGGALVRCSSTNPRKGEHAEFHRRTSLERVAIVFADRWQRFDGLRREEHRLWRHRHRLHATVRTRPAAAAVRSLCFVVGGTEQRRRGRRRRAARTAKSAVLLIGRRREGERFRLCSAVRCIVFRVRLEFDGGGRRWRGHARSYIELKKNPIGVRPAPSPLTAKTLDGGEGS